MTDEVFSCGDYVKSLVDNVKDNCRNVEEMAMLEINARHIPLINSTLCLTNVDCKIILDKCQHHCHNVLETSILLIALTDFISCVSANYETFPIGSKKNETRRITLLMQALKNTWSKLFANLSPADMNISQMTGIVNIIKRCLERIPPESTYKTYMERISNMTDQALQKLLKPPATEDIHDDTEKQSREITSSKSYDVANTPKLPETVFQVLGNKPVDQRKERKRNVKQSCDITKFILKPCENMRREETSKKPEKNLMRKRKFEDTVRSEQAVLGCDQIEKDPSERLEADETPPAKRHSVHDDLINGKMNAFKMLMKPRKAHNQAKQSSENSMSKRNKTNEK
ncbi:Uncharacterized protein GBIM_17195 [Gryllus bimaculatus]|nr:Uncharacterized protein GBIM_17195 [Gryllus bimaculatus]